MGEGLSHQNRNYSVSLIRLIALSFIISCHIMQELDLELAWWFNVGVQIYLCISGFLYGQKDVGEVTSFYVRRFKKILISYYVVYVPYGVFQLLFARGFFNWKEFAKGLFVNGTLKGAGHLWFVHTILICYVLVPLLAAFRNKYVKSNRSFFLFALASIEIAVLLFGYFNRFYTPAWIVCFIIGYILGINEEKSYIKEKMCVIAFGIIAFAGNGIQIYLSYVAHRQVTRFGVFYNYNHVALGIFLFLMMKTIFDRNNLNGISFLLSFTDDYGYEMYLTHHLLILGPFSLIGITNMLWLDIVIILALTIVLACIVKQISGFIEHLLLFEKADVK
ncbi:MAG: acyltransferase [Blautia sp.]|nr:acyltransferase [Blautia sp.]